MKELDVLIKDENFWNNSEKAKQVMQERQNLEQQFISYENLNRSYTESMEIYHLALDEDDQDLLDESLKNIIHLQKKIQSKYIETLFSGEVDSNDTYLEIHAGAGGTESQDWVSMLLRMYLKWAEKKGYKTTQISMHDGDEAGIKSVIISISGKFAHGWLKKENGVHRLVRISPFDSNSRRHTSFASVSIYPIIDDKIDIKISDSDVRIDTYRASGAGGQHVNTTDSAVRITHIPTGIVVQCQNERSQHRNKETAWNMLRAKIYESEIKAREEAANLANMEKSDIGWGHQIRSYVLHPYRQVKDLRTKIESSNPDAILDGDIDIFLESSLTELM
ncbi:MAG: peptide chain release factor 2 [Rhizobiales bacterium TMED28]|nr:MAG: peptide chain release factor 2 [Rhizobiales bacterium TMED28]